jgi:hypothetical protein
MPAVNSEESTMDATAAVRVVARHVIESAVTDRYPEMWDCYPDLGGHDWDAVCDEVVNVLRRVITVPADEFDEAYEVLRNRATPYVIP